MTERRSGSPKTRWKGSGCDPTTGAGSSAARRSSTSSHRGSASRAALGIAVVASAGQRQFHARWFMSLEMRAKRMEDCRKERHSQGPPVMVAACSRREQFTNIAAIDATNGNSGLEDWGTHV